MRENDALNKLKDVFERSETDILVELRMGNGLNEKEYKKLVEALTFCAEEYENLSYLPKKCVQFIVGLYDDMYNFSLLYSSEESYRIKKAAENIRILIQKCTKEKGEIEPKKAQVIARLRAYIQEEGNFFEKLENGKGIDEQQFEKIYDELSQIDDEIHSWKTFPKVLAAILIDLYEIDLFVYQYQNEFNQQEEADEIYDAFERISEVIIGCTGGD